MNKGEILKLHKKGSVKKKILLMLLGGIALGLSGNPIRYFRILKSLRREWEEIDTKAMNNALRVLYKEGLIKYNQINKHTYKILLSNKGNYFAKIYTLDDIKIKKPPRWDGKWRVVMFDVPEKHKKSRDALRMHFKDIGLVEIQKSVFMHPYPCFDEIEKITQFYNIRHNIFTFVATQVEKEERLKKHFKIIN